MIFQHVSGEIKDAADEKVLARVIYDFFLYQYKEALNSHINRQCELNGFKAANKAAEYEYQQANELGWGPKLPYNEHHLKNKEEEVKRAHIQRVEAKALLDFVVNRFINGFIELPKPS